MESKPPTLSFPCLSTHSQMKPTLNKSIAKVVCGNIKSNENRLLTHIHHSNLLPIHLCNVQSVHGIL